MEIRLWKSGEYLTAKPALGRVQVHSVFAALVLWLDNTHLLPGPREPRIAIAVIAAVLGCKWILSLHPGKDPFSISFDPCAVYFLSL